MFRGEREGEGRDQQRCSAHNYLLNSTQQQKAIL